VSDPAEAAKRAAGEAAARLVRSGMTIGLGTGSTAAHFLRALGRRIEQERLDIVGVPTSEATARLAQDAGIRLGALDDLSPLDLAVDGADEIGPDLALIKGGGGALLREKIVAQASRCMVVIADVGKCVERLGRFPLPVEIVRFGVATTMREIRDCFADTGGQCEVVLRNRGGEGPFISDEGNLIADCAGCWIDRPAALATALAELAGVVEHGLFVGFADGAIIGHADGGVTTMGEIE